MLSWQVGDVKITRVVESELPLPPQDLIPAFDAALARQRHPWLHPHFLDDDGNIELSVHALVVESEGRKLLVDTCMGNDRALPLPGFEPLSGPFLADLASIGAPRESIDIVVCTHLHFDHVGWNTMRQGEAWVPTFPNARYLFGREEYEHWGRHSHEFVDLGDTVVPIVEAGLHECVESDHRITGEVRLEPTPGHTPGHVSVRISSRGQDAVITGDMVHHPVQLAEPDWGSAPDSDPARAAAPRRDFARRYGDGRTLVIGTHFAAPTAGRLTRSAAGVQLQVEAPAPRS